MSSIIEGRNQWSVMINYFNATTCCSIRLRRSSASKMTINARFRAMPNERCGDPSRRPISQRRYHAKSSGNWTACGIMGADFRSAWIEVGSRLPGVAHPGLAASVGADTESLKDVIKKELPVCCGKTPLCGPMSWN